MRIFLAFVLVLISNCAVAACDEVAELRKKDMYINISDGGCSTAWIDVSWTTETTKEGDPKPDSKISSVRFDEECKKIETKEGELIGFKCKKNGKSPLAGATFKLKLVPNVKAMCEGEDNGPGLRFICVEGCKKSVPKYLERLYDCC